MSLSPSTVTLSVFTSTHLWDYLVCIQPSRRAPSHFAKRSPTRKSLLFKSLFALNVALKSNECECFLFQRRQARGFRHHDVIIWNCRILALWCHGDPSQESPRWVPVVAGSRATWNSIFYIYSNFLSRFFGSDFQFVSECESRWIRNVCARFERSLVWIHIFANALVAKRINLHPC